MNFKTGDTVYHWKFGKGTIVNAESVKIKSYPIEVKFDSDDCLLAFTSEGSYYLGEPASLSFTPYDLTNGGFSQVRPLPDLKDGDLIYVKSILGIWEMRFFHSFSESGTVCTYTDQRKTGKTMRWSEFSIENPLI